MDISEQTIAGLAKFDQGFELDDGGTVDDLYRVMFYTQSQVNGTSTFEWHEAVRCKDLYQEKMKDDEILSVEFNDPHWICPNVTSIRIHNDPSVYNIGNGTGFFMIIDTCQNA